MRWLLPVVATVLLAGCSTCQPGWVFEWQDPDWRPEGDIHWNPPRGEPLTWPGGGLEATWDGLQRPDGKVVLTGHDTWKVTVMIRDEAEARAAARTFLTPIYGADLAEELATDLGAVDVICSGTPCPPERLWDAPAPKPDVPAAWLEDGTFESTGVGQAMWLHAEGAIRVRLATYHLHHGDDVMQAWLRGDSLGRLQASVAAPDPITERAARGLLLAGFDAWPTDPGVRDDCIFI